MKRKWRGTQVDDMQTCDMILTDAIGRSVRVHKAILVDKSDYFANVLRENQLNELQLDENYLIELIRYLYKSEDNEERCIANCEPSRYASISSAENDDLEILMQLLVLSKKYSFKHLYTRLRSEIDSKIEDFSVILAYSLAKKLEIEEIHSSAKLLILSWLPRLYRTNDFLSLDEKSIREIFSMEPVDIDTECKLNALSAWWSHNKTASMTDLWASLATVKLDIC